MTSKKVLTGFGIFAVLAIALFSIKGFPPTGDGMEGAIGVAKRTNTEQLTSADVVLRDPEIQELLQSDVFLEMIQDEAFQKMVADGSLGRALKVADGGLGARLDPAMIDGFGKVSKLMQDDEGFRKAIEIGDLDKATKIAKTKGIDGDFGKVVKAAKGGFGARLDPAAIDGMGKVSKLMQDDEGFRKAIEIGDLDKATKIAKTKGIDGDFGKAVKLAKGDLGARLDPKMIDGFGKVSKLMQDDEGFRKAIEIGDLDKATKIAKTKGIDGDFGKVVKLAKGGFGARLDPAAIDGMGKVSKLMQDDEGFRKAIEIGDLDKATKIAKTKGIDGDFGKAVKLAKGDLGARLDPKMIDGFGKVSKLMQDDEGFRKAIEIGDLDKATKIAKTKGIDGDFGKVVKLAKGGFGARLDPAAIDGMGKVSKLMQDDEGFRKAIEIGDLDKATKIAKTKGIDGDFGKAVKLAKGDLGARLDPKMIDGFGKVSKLMQDDEGFRKAIEIGDLDKATKIAKTKGIDGDFGKVVKLAKGGFGARLDPAAIDGMGKVSKLMQDDEGFRKAIEIGDLDKATKIAKTKGIDGDFGKAVKLAKGDFGARLDPKMIDGFGKVSNLKGLDELVNNGGFRKLFVGSPGFRQAMADGAPGKFLKSAPGSDTP